MAEVIAKPSGVSRSRRMNLLQEINHHRADYLYILPAYIVMTIVILYPFFYTIFLSFFDTPLSQEGIRFIGIQNYVDLFQEPLFGLVLRNTVIWTLGSTVFSFLLGLLAAILVNQPVPGITIFRAILVIPWVIGHVTAAYAWRWLMHGDFGVISHTLMQLGLIDQPIPFLQSTDLVMWSLVLVNTWKTFPFAMIMLLAGLQSISPDLYEAAHVDGATQFQVFRKITLPLLAPVIMVTTVLIIIGNMNSFTIPYVMTGGGPAYASEIIITWIYNVSFQTLRFGFASAVSVVLFIILFIFSFFYVRALTRGGTY